jgi:hypothetical protein
VRASDGIGVAVGAGVSSGTAVAVGGLAGVAIGEGVAQAEATNRHSRVTIRVILILIFFLLFRSS